jgi:hypothetical protein
MKTWVSCHTVIMVIALALTTTLNSYGQIVFRDSGEETPAEELMSMFDKASAVLKSLELEGKTVRMDIFEIEDKNYLLIDGFFHVMEWKDNDWYNLYKGNLHGYNNGALRFVFDNKIYSYGGYGFWHNHGQLIYFDWKFNEWEIVTVSKDFNQGIAFLSTQEEFLNVISLDGEFKVSLSENTIVETQKIRPSLKRVMDGISGNSNSFETEDYFLFLRGKPSVLINKSNNKAYMQIELAHKLMQKMRTMSYVHVRGNEFRIIDPSGTADTLTESKILAFFDVHITDSKEADTGFSLLYYITFAGLIFISIWFYFKKSKGSLQTNKEKTQAAPQSEEATIIAKLLAYADKSLTQEQLDEILEIQHIMSGETQRFKRAAIVKKINQQFELLKGTPIIRRVKDPKDNRRFIYEINGDTANLMD